MDVRPPADATELFVLLRRTSQLDDEAEVPEPVGALEHARQCASALAATAPDDVELQIAGLVHDLGHLADPHDPDAHGREGARLVRPLLGARIASLVELHVPAKRYLVTTEPIYRSQLSPASAWTLSLQGEAMSDAERAAFEAQRWAGDALVLRRADDQAKIPGLPVPDLDHWEPVVTRWLSRPRA